VILKIGGGIDIAFFYRENKKVQAFGTNSEGNRQESNKR
jgi:hypothetical protein